MVYEKEIVAILKQAGRRGLPVRHIARHVHHEVNSLFDEVDFEDVYRSVGNFVRYHSRGKQDLFRRAKGYGYYRLNKNSDKYKERYGSREGDD